MTEIEIFDTIVGVGANFMENVLEAFDINGKIHKRKKGNFKFSIRVYGLLRINDKVLLQRNKLLKDKYGFPGGAVEIGESLEDSLKREFREETGIRVVPKKLLSVQDDLFTFGDQDYHSILILYLVERVGGELLSAGNGEETAEVRFVGEQDINSDMLQRAFIKFLPVVGYLNK